MPDVTRVAVPPARPLLVYDGDCHFCKRWVARFRNSTGPAIDYEPFQDPTIAQRFPEIPPGDFVSAVRLILPDGTVCSGAEACFRTLSEAGRERWLYGLYQKVPVIADITEIVYDEVARQRSFLSKIDRIYSGPGDVPLSYLRVRFLFLRGLALIYLIAFASLGHQIEGLAGKNGIVPVAPMIRALKMEADAAHMSVLHRWHLMPTVSWWNASDVSLKWQCNAGVILSIALLFGFAPAPVLFLLWGVYLSLTAVCSPFLDFQWDLLLLETGFLAIFFAPWQWRERLARQSAPSSLAIWLLRWLIFRLMFESGVVKLMSGDISWWNLSALRVHYQTQPLPTWIGWYAHQLPVKGQSFCAFVLLFIELIVPVFIFSGRRARVTAAGCFVFLQVLIMLTGNYTFFNWLGILLCVPLLDDDWLRRRPATALSNQFVPPKQRCRRWPRSVLLPVTIVILIMTFINLLETLRIPQRWPAPIVKLYLWLQPYHSFNAYGLFAVMTHVRPEIILEGSNDGHTWLPYEFKYKPGDLTRRPGFVAPYQPRLDWQMWFAALSTPRDNPWLMNLEIRLLQNSPPVLALLGLNPFPNAPPKYIRAQLYDYKFTTRAERHASGKWWKREYIGSYIRPTALPPGAPPLQK